MKSWNKAAMMDHGRNIRNNGPFRHVSRIQLYRCI